ncbi:MAG: hypothetical protein GC131_03380 [Alphaproteobacteria bacterium]|nr:hypothetical protein [Alphaproteobacteria bacterium]
MDMSSYIQFALALTFVLCLIWFLAIAARRWQERGLPIFRQNNRRVRVIEVMPVDTRRRAVLIRRDDREHLILIGGGNDIVIESGITPPPAATASKESPTQPS